MFGEYEIMKGTRRKGTVVCESHTAEAYVLSRSVLNNKDFHKNDYFHRFLRQDYIQSHISNTLLTDKSN